MQAEVIDNSFQWALERSGELLLPPPRITPSQWASDHIKVTDGDRQGPIKFNRGYEYQKDIMDTFFGPFAPGEYRRVGVCFKGAQSGVTTVSQIGLIAWTTHYKVSSFHLLPRECDAKDKAKNMTAMIETDPELEAKFKKSQARIRKTKAGQTLRVAYSNSQSELKNWQGGIGVFDEVDDLERKDFDSVAMAKQRMGSYRRRIEIYIGTPTYPNYGIHQVWMDSDQRFYHVPCPICKKEQVLDFDKNIEFDATLETDEEKASSARFKCAHCDETWDHRLREIANGKGHWVITRPEKKIIGFAISRLYVPSALASKMVSDYLAGLKSDKAMREHYNQNLGKVYLPTTGKLEEHMIEHVIDSEVVWGRIPKDSEFVSVGVDVQGETAPFIYVWELRSYDANGFRTSVAYGINRGIKEMKRLFGSKNKRGKYDVDRGVVDISDGHHKEEVLELCEAVPCLQPGRFDHYQQTKLDRGKVNKSKEGTWYQINVDDALQDNLGCFYYNDEKPIMIRIAANPKRSREKEYIEHYTKVARVKRETPRGTVYTFQKLRTKDVDYPYAGALADYAYRVGGRMLSSGAAQLVVAGDDRDQGGEDPDVHVIDRAKRKSKQDEAELGMIHVARGRSSRRRRY